MNSDLSAFHRVEDWQDHTCQFICPKLRHLFAYKGALRLTLEQEGEAKKDTPEGRAKASGGTVYTDPSKNVEAMNLGIFEAGAG